MLSGALVSFSIIAGGSAVVQIRGAQGTAQRRPNIVMLMTDDTGWNDFGVYSGGGQALGHPTPHVVRSAPLTT